MLTTCSAPQIADMLRSRALVSVTLITPSAQDTIRATQNATSATLGIDRLTGGTKVATTMPVKRAIENWRNSGTSTPMERGPQVEYWRAGGPRLLMEM